ncbi:MAG: ABC transporter substrate-binding protein [Vicinamibacterales bacterium]|jgi:branched-chain amino acid transport system substrate-binding protein/urea transport system substrate-binding protein|nr:ABC transporter substrate-binding protein [Vicinamibacterales bacterium]
MGVTRREFMVGAGAALGAAGTPFGFPAIAQRRPLKVGVFISEVDAQGVDERVEPYVSQMRIGLGLAASEINAMGGILGRPVDLIYRDDGGSPPSRAATAALVADEGCEAIVSGFVMVAPQLIARHINAVDADAPVPIVHGFWTDGSGCNPVAKHCAPTVRQIVPPIRAFIGDAIRARPFSISNWTPSGRRVSEYMYGALGGAHTGDALVTTPVLGNHPGDYRGVMRWAHDMESNIIWNADPRPYAVDAVNQAVELGVAEGKTFAHLDFSEWQASQLVPGAAIITCVPFVAGDASSAVQDFVSRANSMPGGELVTHVAFTHYNSLMALKAAMERSGEASAAGGIAGLDGLTIDTATGPLTFEASGHPTMPMFVATAEGGGPLRVVQKVEQISPGATC